MTTRPSPANALLLFPPIATAQPARWTEHWSTQTSPTRTPSRCLWVRFHAPGQRRSWRNCLSRTGPFTRSTSSETAARTPHRVKVHKQTQHHETQNSTHLFVHLSFATECFEWGQTLMVSRKSSLTASPISSLAASLTVGEDKDEDKDVSATKCTFHARLGVKDLLHWAQMRNFSVISRCHHHPPLFLSLSLYFILPFTLFWVC